MEGEPRNCSALEPFCQDILGPHCSLFLTSVKIMWEVWCASQTWTGAALAPAREGTWVRAMSLRAAAPAGQGGTEPWRIWAVFRDGDTPGQRHQLQRWQRARCEVKAWSELVQPHPCCLERQIQMLWTLGHCIPGTLIRLLSFFSRVFLSVWMKTY